MAVFASVDDAEIEARFGYHRPGPTKAVLHARARDIVRAAALDLLSVVPAGRDQALMLTHLESALFAANAGLARTPLPDDPDDSRPDRP